MDKTLTANQKNFMTSLLEGYHELKKMGHAYPSLACCNTTKRTARNLEKKGYLAITSEGAFEYYVRLEQSDASPQIQKTNKPSATTSSESELLEKIAKYFESKKKKISKITSVRPEQAVLSEVIAEIRSMC